MRRGGHRQDGVLDTLDRNTFWVGPTGEYMQAIALNGPGTECPMFGCWPVRELRVSSLVAISFENLDNSNRSRGHQTVLLLVNEFRLTPLRLHGFRAPLHVASQLQNSISVKHTLPSTQLHPSCFTLHALYTFSCRGIHFASSWLP